MSVNIIDMDIQALLFKLGIPTYVYTVETKVQIIPPAVAADQEIKIGETLPLDLGWIYGVSANVEGVTARDQNQLLPTYLQASDLYLSLKYGQAIYINANRLTNFVYDNPVAGGAPLQPNQRKYTPVNIPLNTDLKQSFISNPTQVGGFTVAIDLWYIDIKTYNYLVSSKQIARNGMIQQ